jgi:hypothetical protein
LYSQKYTRSFSRTVTDNCPARPSLRKEFKEGLKLLPGTAKIHMTVDDFEIITENGKHLGADGVFIQCFGGEIGTFFSGPVRKKNSLQSLAESPPKSGSASRKSKLYNIGGVKIQELL